MRIARFSTPLLFAGLCLAVLVAPDEAPGDMIRLTPSSHRGGSVIFDLSGVRGKTIEAGRLKPGGRRLAVSRIADAAARGKLRVRKAKFRPKRRKALRGDRR